MKEKTKRSTSSDYSFNHVAERSLERYSAVFTEADYVALNKTIKQRISDGEPPAAEDNDSDIYLVEWKDKVLVCVWDKKRACVTTLLPKGTVPVSRRSRFRKRAQ